MEILVLNSNFEAVTILETFESLIWTDRYRGYGDFEIYTPLNLNALTYLQVDYYLWTEESEHVMIIEEVQINSDPENGSNILVTGRSLESILDRRIVWNQTVLNGNLQQEIQRLLNENVISPTITERKIDNFIFEASDDPYIASLEIQAQYKGDNLYDVIYDICDLYSLGFKITLTDDNKLKFKLYSGVDRSFAQDTNPYVIFSPEFDNIRNSNYLESSKSMKTVVFVDGELNDDGVTSKSKVVELPDGGGSGLDRREMYTDASYISSYTEEGELSEAEYLEQLEVQGLIDLLNNSYVTAFEGEMDTTRTFIFGRDFFMGDIVQMTNEYGMEARSRVVELVRSLSPNGIETYPTFERVD